MASYGFAPRKGAKIDCPSTKGTKGVPPGMGAIKNASVAKGFDIPSKAGDKGIMMPKSPPSKGAPLSE